MKVYIVERIGDFDNYKCFGVYNNLESAYIMFMEVVKEFPSVVRYFPISKCERLPYAENKGALYQIVCRAVED
jgi:hypothetical protein